MGKKELDFIKKVQKEVILISGAQALLHWDLETNMPKKAIEGRSEQLALLSGISHEKIIDNKFWDSIKLLKKSKLNDDDVIMVEKLEKDVGKSRKLSKEFVEEMTKVNSKSTHYWEEAKKNNKFEIFEPYLKKVIELQRKKAELCRGNEKNLYDVLLDDYEEGMTEDKLEKEFAKLKIGILKILDKIKKSEVYKKQKLIEGRNFDREKQIELVKDVWRRIGLNEEYSRIDFSEHPFSIRIGENDVRMTVGIRENPLFAFESGIHEAGHTLYSYNFPEKHKYDFLGWEPSLGMHESQSRFWENMIGKGKPFWKFYFPKFKNAFNLSENLDEFYHHVNFVKPHLIRIESDELHYCLHVILRFEIEKELINGKIEVRDLPKIWNKKIKDYLGLEVPSFSKGVLQDVHWSQGSFGYFPTYLIGTMYACQLYDAMNEDFNVDKEIESGEYGKIISWLNDKVHKHGRKMTAEEIMKKATGNGLNSNCFLDYLEEKYSEIYNFK